jgi:hypothetical protein
MTIRVARYATLAFFFANERRCGLQPSDRPANDQPKGLS